MTKRELSKSMRRLPVADRIELLEELSHSIAADQQEIRVTTGQKAMIDECLKEIEEHPGRGMSLGEFRKMTRQMIHHLRRGKMRKSA